MMTTEFIIKEINPITFAELLFEKIRNGWKISDLKVDHQPGVTSYIAEIYRVDM